MINYNKFLTCAKAKLLMQTMVSVHRFLLQQETQKFKAMWSLKKPVEITSLIVIIKSLQDNFAANPLITTRPRCTLPLSQCVLGRAPAPCNSARDKVGTTNR